MELFKKELLIDLKNNQQIIVPKSFLKILIIDNKTSITIETIKEYLALGEICEIERFTTSKIEYIKFELTQKGEYFLNESRKVTNTEINHFISRFNITTYKTENTEKNINK